MDGRHTLLVDGFQREYVLHRPARDVAEPAPLVIVLHGGGGGAEFALRATGWSEEADHAGFFVAYPDALRRDPHAPGTFLRNPRFWHVRSNPSTPRKPVDDVRFLEAMIDELCARAPVDPRRVFVSGFSNGASMALRLACERAERVRAIAPVAGSLWDYDVAPARPVPAIFVQGDADPLNPLEGGQVRSPWGGVFERPPVRTTVETWARWIGCPPEPAMIRADAGVTALRYGSPSGGATVEFHVIHGLGHVWPGGRAVLSERISGPNLNILRATDLIWEFFSRV